jgi:hypothetical protein
MKQQIKWSAWWVMAALTLTRGEPAAAMADEGILERVQGQVEITGIDGTTRPGQAGMLVQGGEIVETGTEALVRILLPDESVIELKANSRIEINDSRANPGAISSVLLYLGWLWAEIAGSQAGDTTFELVTPSAVAGVRGTAFSAGVGIDGATRLGVDQGEVKIEGEGGSVTLQAEQEAVVEMGSAPGPVSSYRRGEDEWTRWVAGRQGRLLERAEMLAAVAERNVRMAQSHLVSQTRELKRLQRRWEAYERRERRRGGAAALAPAFRRVSSGKCSGWHGGYSGRTTG